MKKQLIIPFFIPFGGCPERCVFCDQRSITGAAAPPSQGEIAERIERYLETWKKRRGGGMGGKVETAFYGGSFTALPLKKQEWYLSAVEDFLKDGRVHGIRVSTRPDCISEDILHFLSARGVDTVEVGVQSMNDRVLELSGRGHSVKETVSAVRLLRRTGMKVGLQFMPGLPGDDAASIMETALKIVRLAPDFVRIYPALVIEDTPLEAMYLKGEYRAWTLEDMVNVCKTISALFKEAGIKIIRMGLHVTGELKDKIVAGPYHASFRNLVECNSQTVAQMAGGRAGALLVSPAKV